MDTFTKTLHRRGLLAALLALTPIGAKAQTPLVRCGECGFCAKRKKFCDSFHGDYVRQTRWYTCKVYKNGDWNHCYHAPGPCHITTEPCL